MALRLVASEHLIYWLYGEKKNKSHEAVSAEDRTSDPQFLSVQHEEDTDD